MVWTQDFTVWLNIVLKITVAIVVMRLELPVGDMRGKSCVLTGFSRWQDGFILPAWDYLLVSGKTNIHLIPLHRCIHYSSFGAKYFFSKNDCLFSFPFSWWIQRHSALSGHLAQIEEYSEVLHSGMNISWSAGSFQICCYKLNVNLVWLYATVKHCLLRIFFLW